MDLSKTKFVFFAHEIEGATGFPAAFAPYLQARGAHLTYIKFPFFISHTKSIWIEKWQGSDLVSKKRSVVRFYQPQLLSFLKDVTWLVFVGWRHAIGADFVLVTNNLLGVAALFFRKIGLIKKFTYLVVDYSPRRFSFAPAEMLYRYLDQLVARNADSVWTMNLEMLAGRERDGRFKLSETTYRIAPMGNYSHLTFAQGEVPYKKTDLVFIGNPNAKNVRSDLLLDVASELAKTTDDFRLIFVGPGNSDHLAKKAAELGLTRRVVFRGSIPGAIEVEQVLAACGIGLAPYDPNLKGNFSNFADSAKIKTYLGCSLPVISTAVPPLAKEVESNGAGFVADFSAADFAKKIKAVWATDQGYVAYRAAALNMGQAFSWNSIFDRLMKEEGFGE